MLNKSLMLLMLQIGALELHLVPLLVITFDHPDQADQLDKLRKTWQHWETWSAWKTWPTWLTWPTKLTNLEKLTNLKNLTKMFNPTWARPWPTSPDLPPAIAILVSFQSSLLLGNFPFNLFCCWEIRKTSLQPPGVPPPPHTHTRYYLYSHLILLQSITSLFNWLIFKEQVSTASFMKYCCKTDCRRNSNGVALAGIACLTSYWQCLDV